MAVETVQMKVSGLMCSFCTMSVEKALKRYEGVKGIMVNLVHGVVLVEADTAQISREELAHAVERLGYSVSSTEVQQFAADDALHGLIRRRGFIGMGLSILAVLLDPLNLLAVSDATRPWLSFAIAAFVLLWVGYPILLKTGFALRDRVINANVLLSAAAWGSFAVGTASLFDSRWPNYLPVAAWLMSLHLFFGYFKLDVRKKASEAVRKLLSLQPATARVIRRESIVEVSTENVTEGEICLVRPGERIPLDGEVVEGVASVDQSSITGESIPSTKEPGSEVLSGTLNLDGALRIRVTRVGKETFLSQIVRLMMQIAERKPPVELLADRLMNYYGPVVLTVAVLTFIGWVLATGSWVTATVVALTTVIMGYPCALGISTPMLAAIAGGKGVSVGFLVKASEVFHALAQVDTLAFDKTGTLTYGRPTVTDVEPVAMEREALLGLAGGLEAESEHPLAQAITFYAQREGAKSFTVTDFRAIPGKGVVARLDADRVVAGRPSFVEEEGVAWTPEARSRWKALAAQGKTVVVVAQAGQLAGLIALQDTPRRSVEDVVARTHARGLRTVMLTGDSKAVAEAIAEQLGIESVRSELLPTEKVEAIEELQAQGRKVAMVGDGINDAPALAQADVGIAIGAGTDVAIESAGVILVGDRLHDVLNALSLGKASYRTLTANVVIAVLFNLGGIAAATAGLITPLLAIGIMIASIFAILLNTLRVRALRFEREEDAVEEAVLSEVELRVPNMVCEGCAEQISDTLREIAGVHDIRSRVSLKQVYVRYEPKTVEPLALRQALEQAGFTAVER